VPRIVETMPGGRLVVDVGAPGSPAYIECLETELLQRLEERERIIKLSQEDPLRYGCELPQWADADRLLELTWLLPIFGGNRAAKTEYCLKRAMRLLATKEKVAVLLLQNNDKMSKRVHQDKMWEYMPPEWRNLKRGKGDRHGNISYDDKNGFSDGVFTTPLGGICMFGNYLQYDDSYEGVEFDLIVGDENLPLTWLKNLKRGLATRRGKMLWPFTPIDGMTLAINEVVAGARTVESRAADPELLDPRERHVKDCPPGHMPYIRKAEDVYMIYFHSAMNPFSDYGYLKTLYGGEHKERRMARFFGYCEKTTRVRFSKFGDHNIIPHAKMMEIIRSLPGGVTRYQVIDPAGARNMYMIWVAVDERKRHFIYREWPDKARYGDWAVASEDAGKWDGDMGPAQANPLGHSILSYKRLILAEEGNKQQADGSWKLCGEEIYERYTDPRSGAARAITDRDGGQSLIDRFAEEHEDRDGVLIGPPLYFRPAPGLPERVGIDGDREGEQGINDLLDYDEEQPITPFVNEPALYISDACGNLIWALKNYTGNDGAKAACKDPIDCTRYMATAKLEHLTEEDFEPTGGGSY
jgi:hypothetical protein